MLDAAASIPASLSADPAIRAERAESEANSARAVSRAGSLLIDGLGKDFTVDGNRRTVLEGISLRIEPGEFFCIVGGSGCGKSTLLRVIAGLEKADRGVVSLGGQTITRPGVERGMVFQEPRLLPWLTVWDNVAFGLSNMPAAQRRQTVVEHIRLVGLEGFERAYPHQLSGGMAQRVGLARALVNRPAVLLLDEPFGALDALTRLQMQQEIANIWQVERTTMILVTHDIDEAIYLGDRIAVLGGRPGAVRQVFEVDLPRPRARGQHRFDELRQAIADSIFDHGSPVRGRERCC